MRFVSDAKLDPSQVEDRRNLPPTVPSTPTARPSATPPSALSIVADAQARMSRGFRRWSPGILGGRTEVASPVSPSSRGTAVPVTRASASGSILFLGAARPQSLPFGVQHIITWDIPDGTVNFVVGSSFSFAAGSPANIVINEDCEVHVTTRLRLNSSIFGATAGELQLKGTTWGNTEDMRSISATQLTFEVSFTARVLAGSPLSVGFSHNDVDDNLSVSDGSFSVFRL